MENQPTVSPKKHYDQFWSPVWLRQHCITQLLIYVFGNIYEPHWSIHRSLSCRYGHFYHLGNQESKRLPRRIALTMGEAIKTGLGIALISSIIYSIIPRCLSAL